MAYNQSDGAGHNTGDAGKLVLGLDGATYRALALDSSGNVSTSAASPTTLGDGTVSLTGGVAQQVSVSSVPCKFLFLSPVDTNAAEVRIGGSSLTTSTGKQLYQGEDFGFQISDLNAVYLISSSNATVTYMYTV